MLEIHQLARTMESDLRARADPERQEVTRGYFPSSLEILGVAAAGIRDVIRNHRTVWRGLSPEHTIELALELVRSGTHEGRQAGYEILEKRNDTRPLLDRSALEALGAGNDNWASVDTFATRVAGPAWREGHTPDSTLRAWAAHQDLWWRRTAVVCTVALNLKARGGTGDVVRTLDICTRVASDGQDMVAKGLSWALRSLVAHDAAAVRGFVEAHEEVLAARVMREVRSKLKTGLKNP